MRGRAWRSCAGSGSASGSPATSPTALPRSSRRSASSCDLVATSAAWGVEKPSPAFFARIASELALSPEAIAYVGDRVDNDVIPAAAAGMTSIFIRRGPWAWIQCPVGSPPEASFVIEDLTSLPDLLRSQGRGVRLPS